MFKKIVILSLLFLFLITSLASAEFYLPDTGQILCYDASGNATDCSNTTGQDGAYSINPMSYIDNDDGTVTDRITGLIWQKCSVGQNNDTTCSGTATTSTWDQAQTVCGELNLGNKSDWRLPSKKELITIVDYGVSYPGPTIEEAYFPNTVSGSTSYYWSSTPNAADPGTAWYTTFDYGSVYHASKNTPYYVRCVHGEPTAQSFKDNGNGTVTDNRAGLTWQKKAVKAVSYRIQWADALSYCAGLSLGGHSDWRLPDAKEFESLADDTRFNPSIDTKYFPNTDYKYYWWSSTTRADSPTYAWYVAFGGGTVANIDTKDFYLNVRCVRGKNSWDITPPVNGTLSISPGGVNTTFDLSWSGFTDAQSEVASYILVSSTAKYPACSATPIYAGPGTSYPNTGLTVGKTYYYRVCAVDNYGNVSTGVTAAKKVLPESDPPTGGSVTINGGDTYTKSRAVTLTLSATDANPPLQMCVSNTGVCKAWRAFASTKKWNLSAANGDKTVNVWFRDKFGNADSTPYSDSITLDTVKPVNGTLTVSQGAANTSFDLSWKDFSDALSGLASYRLVYSTAAYPACSAKPLYAGTETSFPHTGLTVGKTYYYRVCAIDNAGNISTGAKAKMRVSP